MYDALARRLHDDLAVADESDGDVLLVLAQQMVMVQGLREEYVVSDGNDRRQLAKLITGMQRDIVTLLGEWGATPSVRGGRGHLEGECSAGEGAGDPVAELFSFTKTP